jgi:hypothetical protein
MFCKVVDGGLKVNKQKVSGPVAEFNLEQPNPLIYSIFFFEILQLYYHHVLRKNNHLFIFLTMTKYSLRPQI